MEGSQIDFFITYNNHQTIIRLSEYDTVEQLKIEIDIKFNIPVMYQVIDGWTTVPESDDTILRMCSELSDVNCLKVRRSDHEPMLTDENKIRTSNFVDLEESALRSVQEKLPRNNDLNLPFMSLKNAVSFILACSATEKKALLIYLHNSNDVFSQNFLMYLNDRNIVELLSNSFVICGWDVSNETYHEALVSALNLHENMQIPSKWITEKTAAVLCLVPQDNKFILTSCIRGDISYVNVLNTLKNVQQLLSTTGRDEMDLSESVGEQANSYENLEIESTRSLERKLPLSNSLIFRHCTLDDAICSICTSPLFERKALFMYFHNSSDPFSKVFMDNLGNDELLSVLNRTFLLFGWDVEETKYHDALISALNNHVNLSLTTDLVKSKIAVGLCILPVGGVISVFSCFRGKVSVKDMIKGLKNTEETFRKEMEREKELQDLKEEKCKDSDLGSEQLQGIWADMLGDRDYDRFEHDEHKFLKDKIGFALKGQPKKETGYDKKEWDHINKIYDVITKESSLIAEYKDTVEISFIYICLEPLPEEKVKRAKKFRDYNPQTDVSPVPVFVLRKCRESDEPCRIFIDDTGRVYQDWQLFLLKNKYPECEMITPLNGRYTVKDEKVLLEKHLSPACHLDTKILQVGDIVSTAAGLASGAVFIAAGFITAVPVGLPVLVGAGVAGAAAGVWAIGRSIQTLYDRSMHKESLSIADSDARGAYLNIVAGSLGFVGAGANMAVSQLAANGFNLGKGATYLVNTIGVANITASGASVGNSAYEVFNQWIVDNQTPSALTILQLSTSVLFFGHAVYNFKGAQTIIDETQTRVLQDYQDSLRSNRHRKTFNKLVKETLRTQADGTRGRAEVISAIKNILNKDEVFAALTRNNRAMNRNGVRFSAEGGQIRLNGISFSMDEFISLNKKQSQSFIKNVSQQGPSQQSNFTGSNVSSSFTSAVKNIISDIKLDHSQINITQVVLYVSDLMTLLSGDVRTKLLSAVHQAVGNVLNKLAKPLLEELDKIIPKTSQFMEFVNLGLSFFSRKVDEYEKRYQHYHQTGNSAYYDTLFDHINPVYAKRCVTFFEFIVRNSFSGEYLFKNVLNELSSYITAWIAKVIYENDQREEREENRRRHSAGYRPKKINCKVCGGYYYSNTS